MSQILTFKDLILQQLQKQGFSVLLLISFSYYFYHKLTDLELQLQECQSKYHESLVRHIEDSKKELLELKMIIANMKANE